MIVPAHLLEQAQRMIDVSGRPRQVNLRRAVSSAYYALFHFTMAAAADMVAGRTARSAAPDLYKRVYRAIDHADLRSRLSDGRLQAISRNIARFASAVINLQQARHKADYDPFDRISKTDAVAHINDARDAIAAFEAATLNERQACLTSVLFRERRT